ncbi:MAG: YhbY family RNA-binding protein [Burkholderiales bacterium]|jgi:RNA-binding protein|nr:YhbY family RNA-binding protein [Burkholderiales bacterium]
MSAIELTPAQRKEHRAAAHHLLPVVIIGAEGATAAVVKEIDVALTAHGLIKVRVFSDDRPAREALLQSLADELNAAPIQHIGKLLVLWRPQPKARRPEAAEEASKGARPRVIKLLTFSKSGSQRAQIKKVTVLGNERLTAGGLVKRAKKRTTGSSVKKRSQGA